MRSNLLTALSTKAVLGVAAVALATGTAGAALVVQPASSSTTSAALEADTTTLEDDITVDDDVTLEDDITLDDGDDTAEDGDDTAEDGDDVTTPTHPDNFGAVVSADAKDGGVDGQEISALAHARNAARQDATTDEDEDEDESVDLRGHGHGHVGPHSD